MKPSTYQVHVTRALVIWHVRAQPTKSSGNSVFDDSARAMLEKLMEDRRVDTLGRRAQRELHDPDV